MKDRARQELLEKLGNMYLQYWQVNNKLIDINLSNLLSKDLVRFSEKYEITEKGLDILVRKERNIEQHLTRGLSKETCATYSFWANVVLSALEFIIGLLSGSIGLIADAVHTAIDIVASAITWIGIKINKEAQTALFGGIILFGIGVFIAFESITKIFEPTQIQLQVVALITIVINIAVNSLFSFYKFYVGGRTRSISLVADAYHTKTDIWSSAAVLVGLLGSVVGFLVLDAIVGVVVSFFILLGGYELVKESSKVMHGEDPKLEKFSKFLESHLKVLQQRGVFVGLWLFNLKDMTKQENLERMKKGFGKHFSVKLEEEDYQTIYTILENDTLIESVGDLFRLTEKGKEKLKILAKDQTAYLPWLHRKNILSSQKIDWFA
jgi:cation diffusion facilitator family transporter